jgi:MFS family permease
MTDARSTALPQRSWVDSLPFYYGWVHVVLGSLAMTATLPGRTHGLGLITEPLLRDLALDRVVFTRLNFVGSLVGAAFCLPIGWAIDRWGVRAALTGVTLALAASVLGMSECHGAASLLIALILVRGLGQSALSVVSMAAVGKWFDRRAGVAMGVFAVLLTFGFIGSVLGVGVAVDALGWRAAWQGVGYSLLAVTPVFALLARSTPEACGLPADGVAAADDLPPATAGNFTLRQALATPAFWVVTLGSSAFNLVWSGVTLLNESMIAERGLAQDQAVRIMAILTGIGLVANLACGRLATRERVIKLLGGGLLVLAGGLAAFPLIDSPRGAAIYALTIGASGGIVTVVFFAAWGHLFGRANLGRIQGAAQLATVLASATGPVLMAESAAAAGSYAPAFYALAAAIAVLALVALITPTPSPR